jgi:hypothetical protein
MTDHYVMRTSGLVPALQVTLLWFGVGHPGDVIVSPRNLPPVLEEWLNDAHDNLAAAQRLLRLTNTHISSTLCRA